MHMRNLDKLVEVNARLMRARQEYRSAVDAEHKARFSQLHAAVRAKTAEPADNANQRVRRAAQEFELALDEFIKFKMANYKTSGHDT